MCSTTRKLGAFLMINTITACQQKEIGKFENFVGLELFPIY